MSALDELLAEACAHEGRVYWLAGGTDLGVTRHAGTLPEGRTLCLWGIPELARIEESEGVLRIGAAVTIASLLESSAVREGLPLLVEALSCFASPQIRSLATLGGNICNGSPTADTVPPLLAMEAELELSSPGASRRLPLASFFTGYKKNVLRRGEIVAAVLVRSSGLRGYRTYYRKVGSRAGMTIAKLSVAAAARARTAEPRILDELRVAVGSLNEYPRRLPALEALLRGRDPAEVGAPLIEEAVRSQITPITDFRSDADYRARVCVDLILAFLQSAVPE